MKRRELERALRAIRTAEYRIQPDAAWMRRTRDVLMMQVKNGMPTEDISIAERARSFARSFLPARFVRVVRGPVLAAFSIFAMVAGTSIASVSAAEKAIPGDFLYQLKIATEQTRLAFTKGKSDRLKLKTEFTIRRGQEIKEIVASPSNAQEKTERIKQTTDMLKRDLDTVKNQLNEVSREGTATEAAQAAKNVDQKSDELVTALKSVKPNIDGESRSNILEAEAAAITTGVKAVQVLIDVKDKPEAKDVVTNDEIVSSINKKKDGVEETVKDTAQKLFGSEAASTTLVTVVVASSTFYNGLASTTTTMVLTSDGKQATVSNEPLAQIQTAQNSLTETTQLLASEKLNEASDKLLEAANAVVAAQKAPELPQTQTVIGDMATGTTPVLVPTSVTSSVPTSESSVLSPQATPVAATGTVVASPPKQ